jgi:hypothetical protein
MYLFSDLIKDSPIIVNYGLEQVRHPEKILKLIIVLVLLILTRLLQKLVGLLFTPPLLIYYSYKLLKKNEVSNLVPLTHSVSTKYIIRIIFKSIPQAMIFRGFYMCLKKIIKRDKSAIRYGLVVSNLLVNIILGTPLWVLSMANTINLKLEAVLNQNLDGKTNKMSIR